MYGPFDVSHKPYCRDFTKVFPHGADGTYLFLDPVVGWGGEGFRQVVICSCRVPPVKPVPRLPVWVE